MNVRSPAVIRKMLFSSPLITPSHVLPRSSCNCPSGMCRTPSASVRPDAAKLPAISNDASATGPPVAASLSQRTKSSDIRIKKTERSLDCTRICRLSGNPSTSRPISARYQPSGSGSGKRSSRVVAQLEFPCTNAASNCAACSSPPVSSSRVDGACL